MPSTTPMFAGQGQRHQDALVSDLPLLREWSWPYVTLTGRRDGPLATALAGVHGGEYVSIRAARRLARELDPAAIRGRVLVLPVLNLPAYWERTPFVCPLDGKNPNRFFPGDPHGTFSEAMDHFVSSSCIAPADALLDLHGGDLVEELVPFAIYAADAAPEVVARSRAMAEAFGLTYTIAQREEPGALAGMTYAAAARRGLPRLIAEVRAGEAVRAGQRLGQILDLLGEPVETVAAPRDGVVVFRTTSAAVKERGLLLALGA